LAEGALECVSGRAVESRNLTVAIKKIARAWAFFQLYGGRTLRTVDGAGGWAPSSS